MEEARIEKLSRMVGGRFKLAALIQKRMQQLVHGSTGFGEPVIDGIFRRVLAEIEEGQVTLKLPSGEEEAVESLPEEVERPPAPLAEDEDDEDDDEDED